MRCGRCPLTVDVLGQHLPEWTDATWQRHEPSYGHIDPHRDPPGTLICDEEEIVEQQVVTGIAYAKDEAQISLRRVGDRPGVAAGIFGPLAEANINVDMIVQNISEDGRYTDITFTVPVAEYERSLAILRASNRPYRNDCSSTDRRISRAADSPSCHGR